MKLLSSTLLKYHGTEPGLCEDSRWMVNKVLLNRRGRRGMRRGTQSTPFSATSAKNSATSAVSFILLSPLNRVFTQPLPLAVLYRVAIDLLPDGLAPVHVTSQYLLQNLASRVAGQHLFTESKILRDFEICQP